MRVSNCWLAMLGLFLAGCGAPRVVPGKYWQNGHSDQTLPAGTLRGPKDAGYNIDVPIALCLGDATLLRFSPQPGQIELMQSAFSCPTTTPTETDVLTNEQAFAALDKLQQGFIAGIEAAGFVVEVGEPRDFEWHVRFRRNEWYGEIYIIIGWGWRAYYAIVQRAKVAGQPKCWGPRTKTLPSFVSPTKTPSLFAPDC